MTDFLDLPTIAIIVVAIVILLRLRSVLGTRTGNERQPGQDRFRARDDSSRRDKEDTVIPMRPRTDPARDTGDTERRIRKLEAEIEQFSRDDDAIADGLRAIAEADANFTPKQFLEGAKSAYEMIVTAFAAGDRKTLKSLLEKDVYDGFEAAIAEREQKAQTVDFTFVGLPLIEFSSAELDKKVAQVTIHFKAEIVSATKDASGQLIEGNEEQIQTIADAWTFARNTRSRDPNWKLVATDRLD